MRISVHKYNDMTVRMPQGADPTPLKTLVKAMGWNFVIPTVVAEKQVDKAKKNTARPSQRLRGIFKMSADFDYKDALRHALKEKYEL